MTPVMAYGDLRASRGVMDVYIRLWNVGEEGRGSGQGVAYRTGNASRNEAALPVRGSMHGQWTATRVKVPSEGIEENGGRGMQEERLTERDAPSLESMLELRLLALLHDLVTSRGPMQTAELPGVNYKTVARSMEAGRRSVYLREALMEQLIARRTVEGPADLDDGGEDKRTLGALGERVTALAGVDELRSSVAQEMGAMREEQAGIARGLERRLAHVEAQREGGAGADGGPKTTPTPGASEPQRERARRRVYRTTHPKVVTAEPEDWEEDVYGDAEPLVIAWRRARDTHRMARGRLARAETGERELELAIALMEGHGLWAGILTSLASHKRRSRSDALACCLACAGWTAADAEAAPSRIGFMREPPEAG